MRKHIVVAQRLYYSKKGRPWIQNGNLAVLEREIFVLIGPEGSGKTTLFQLLSGCIKPERGILALFGNPTPSFKEYRKVGFVQEDEGFYENMSGRANLKMKALAFGNYRKELIEEAVQITGLEHIVRKKVKSYTQEQKIRLGIAMAIVGSPRLLLLDEPFAHIFEKEREDLLKMIKRLNQKYGLTILISASDPQSVKHVGTSYGMIKKGVLAMQSQSRQSVSQRGKGKKKYDKSTAR